MQRELDSRDRHSPQQLRDYLRLVREARVRDSERVARHGATLLAGNHRSLSLEELWLVHEQVAVAALDTGNAALAARLVRNANARFPTGARASRLMGMAFEAAGEWAEAARLYSKELERDPTCTIVLKRQVAVRRAQGDVVGAAELLRSYLTTQATDAMAWEEAADLYLQAGQLAQATFCLEECLLHLPQAAAPRLLLADTQYALGGTEAWADAARNYSAVVELTDGRSVRALYGLCACATQPAAGGRQRGSGGGSGKDGGVARAAAAAAAEALVARYAAGSPGKLPLVKAMLKAQGLL